VLNIISNEGMERFSFYGAGIATSRRAEVSPMQPSSLTFHSSNRSRPQLQACELCSSFT
jgi:hypothetical protein